MTNILVSSFLFSLGFTHTWLPKTGSQKRTGEIKAWLINTFPRSAINVRGSTILLAGGSQGEPGVDKIHQ